MHVRFLKRDRVTSSNTNVLGGFEGPQELEKTADSNIESEEPGSATSSNSSSVHHAGRKESPIFSPSPVQGHPDTTKNMKNLPPLPKSKARTTKYNKDGNMYSSNQISRSASTREFRKLNQRDQLEVYAVDN